MNKKPTDGHVLSWRECLTFSVMSEDEMIALQARQFDFVAAHIEPYLITSPDGRLSLRIALADDICEAIAAGDTHRSASLKRVLLHFMQLNTARAA
ncbi:MAG: hypothetical protein AB7E79_09375 [Rhodospirillaceae bacterium]